MADTCSGGISGGLIGTFIFEWSASAKPKALPPVPPFYETCCGDSHRCDLVRHRADGHARRHRSGVSSHHCRVRCGEASPPLSVRPSPRQPDESSGAFRSIVNPLASRAAPVPRAHCAKHTLEKPVSMRWLDGNGFLLCHNLVTPLLLGTVKQLICLMEHIIHRAA